MNINDLEGSPLPASKEDATSSMWHWIDVAINWLGALVTSIAFWKGAGWLAALYVPVWILVAYVKELAPFIDYFLYDTQEEKYKIPEKFVLLIRKNSIRVSAFVLTWLWAHAIWPEGYKVFGWHEDKTIILLAILCPYAYDAVIIAWRILKWIISAAYKVLAKPLIKRFFPNANVDALPELPDLDDLGEDLASRTTLAQFTRAKVGNRKAGGKS